MKTTFGANVIWILHLKHLTLNDISRETNFSLTYLQNRFHGIATVSSEVLFRVSTFLGVPSEALLSELTSEQKLELTRIEDKKFLNELIGNDSLYINDEYLVSTIRNSYKNINDICALKNITFTSLAKSLNMSVSTLRNCIDGKVYFPPSILKSVMNELNITLEELILGVPNMTPDAIYEEILDAIPDMALNLQQILVEENITCDILAEKTGFSYSTIVSYLNGQSQINIEELQVFSSALNIPIDQILLKNVNLSKNITVFCILNGLTTQGLASKANICISIVTKIKNQKQCPNIINLKRISYTLGISLKELLLGLPKEQEEIILDSSNFAKNLKHYLSLKNITQKQLAEMASLDTKTVYSIVNNHSSAITTSRYIAEALNVSIPNIIFGNFSEEELSDEKLAG